MFIITGNVWSVDVMFPIGGEGQIAPREFIFLKQTGNRSRETRFAELRFIFRIPIYYEVRNSTKTSNAKV